jgi:hypothetical protein
MAGEREIGLEVGLKKAVDWIVVSRKADPHASLLGLIDEACRRYDLSPIQAEYLHRCLAGPARD